MKIIGSYRNYAGVAIESFICEGFSRIHGELICELLNDHAQPFWTYKVVPMSYVMNPHLYIDPNQITIFDIEGGDSE